MNDIQPQETTVIEIPIQREQLQRYMFVRGALSLLLLSVMTYGIGFIVLVIYLVWYGKYWTRRWVPTLSYRVEGSVLHIEGGVFFRKSKAIPLERITDLVISEGPLMRRYGIRELRVQTAGRGQARLWAVESPEGVRQHILDSRRSGVAPR
ncbi:hypothetical protein LCGC14_0489860 [marine sediment metagenome]|uniref:YdbS-like PH domain-containing protein n=1 Tax=marine sediment metagenome TaxID=412755 RepID=A0A0F9VFL7_9ZZZZ|nr:PH domain-containing protein [Phycisphaerae bacterium]HDZ43596.1 PH domain-containing protein [Phycisphaerae bacterium]